MRLIKSDGSFEDFNLSKVKKGVQEAYDEAGEKKNSAEISEILDEVSRSVYDGMSTWEIRRIIEESLVKKNFKAGRRYILHWAQKEAVNQFVIDKERFISKYKKSVNNADATVDDNSNVNGKNISLINAEIHKSDNMLVSRGMITRKLRELYPTFNSRNYVKDLDSHIIYKHDESSFAGAIAPYTYSSKEVIEVKYNGSHLLVPFDLLWNIVEEEEVLVNNVDEVYQKYPDNLYVRERGNEFVHITTLTKKKRHRDLVRVKTAFGEDIIVTDNHPMIIDENDINNTIEAVNSVGSQQFKTNDTLEFGDKRQIDLSECPDVNEYSDVYCINYSNQAYKRFVDIDWNLGYFVGFFVGDGHYNNANGRINFTQKDRNVLVHLNNILFKSLGVAGTIRFKKDKYNCYSLSTSNTALWWILSEVFKIQDKSENKTLPINMLEYGEDFSKGLLCGLIDADGTVNNAQLSIRLASRAAVLQATALLRHFNYGVGNIMQNLPFSNNENHFHTNYTVWGVNCSARESSIDLGDSFKLNKIQELAKDSNLKYKKDGSATITNVVKIGEKDSFLGLNEYIYDITTESKCFSLNNLLVHNCASISMYPFLINGIENIGGLSAAPKNIDSFCGMYCNLLFAVASQFAGAVATPEVLVFFDYFARKEWGDDYYKHPDEEISCGLVNRKKTIKSQIHQYFQQMIYTANQPAASRNGQSCFLNFSYFDKPFFDAMFENFYFPDGTRPLWDSLNWLQKDFMMWFNEERLRCLLTFPVESFALIYKDGKFVDEENAKFVADELERGHSFFIYISDTADSLSSCCFGKKTRIMYSKVGSKTFENCEEIGEAYEKHKDDVVEVLSYNPYTNTREWAKATFVKAESDNLYKITFDNRADWTDVVATHDHIFPISKDGEYIDVEVKNLKVGDKILADKAQWNISDEDCCEIFEAEIKTIEKITEKQDVFCLKMENEESPYFVLSNGLITHNCRLKNKIQTREFSFTNGNIGVETGSKSVITLNLNRITQDFCKKEFGERPLFTDFTDENLSDYRKHLVKILERVYKYHNAYNELLWDMYNSDLLPVYKAGFIDLNKQYLTIGLNGLNQAAEYLGLECHKNDDYSKFCRFIFGTVKEENEKHKTKKATFNTEQVPAESLAVKNYNWDKADGYWVPDDTNLYASYIFKPNDDDSVLDKLYMMGRNFATDQLDGGAAAHINLSEHLSSKQYQMLLEYAANVGCSYWTVNVPNAQCECGFITKHPITKCPKCGSEKITYYDRVIGYLTKVPNWSEGRRIEQKTRKYLTEDKIGF